MLKKNKIKVLRVGNLPSNLNPGQGEAAHQLFRSRLFQTVMFSHSIPYNNYDDEIKEIAPVSDHVHFFGMYIGNFPDLDESDIEWLCKVISDV